MSAKIICFLEAQKRLRERAADENQEQRSIAVGSKCRNTSCRPNSFFDNYNRLLNNLNSKNTKYRYPTILADYRRSINPVDALYQNLQEVLFKYDEENDFCVWLIDQFKDHRWVDELIRDLKEDCQVITEFQIEHYNKKESEKLEYLNILQNVKTKFRHYIEVFEMMKDCRY
jgi:hypothetical protein